MLQQWAAVVSPVASSDQIVPAVFFVKTLGVPRAGFANVVADDFVGDSHGFQGAGPEFARLFKHEDVLGPRRRNRPLESMTFIKSGRTPQNSTVDVRVVHPLVKTIEHAHAHGVGISGPLESQDDDSRVGPGGLGDRVQVLFQLRRRAEEDFAFQAVDPNPVAGSIRIGWRSRTTRSGVMVSSVS